MSFSKVTAGKNAPEDINVIIEIPANYAPIKYEVDKEMDALIVDRFVATPMFYPANYGYVPQSLGDDGDPIDVLVVTPYPLQAGVVVRARPIGVLRMTDEKGADEKILAVPHSKLTTIYDAWQDIEDVPQLLKDQIKHFFENYKSLEAGKWVKLESWENKESAHKFIKTAVEAYK